jgi:ribosomal protein L44E
MNLNYEDERYCERCDKYTPHTCRDSEHERDSSYDYQQCRECGWWKTGFSNSYHPPIGDDDEP